MFSVNAATPSALAASAPVKVRMSLMDCAMSPVFSVTTFSSDCSVSSVRDRMPRAPAIRCWKLERVAVIVGSGMASQIGVAFGEPPAISI